MYLLSSPRRPRRSHEWDAGKAVTFVVTLAATQSVTLAAKEAGMSRKSAYALKERDPAFAAVWNAAAKRRRREKTGKAEARPAARAEGDNRAPETMSKVSSDEGDIRRRVAEAYRDQFFARLAELRDRGAAHGRVSL